MVRLRELREARKLTQGQLAVLLKVHRSYINKIELEQRLPGRDLLLRLADFFDVPVEKLVRKTKKAKGA